MHREIYLLSPVRKEGTVSLPMISFTLHPQVIELSEYDYILFTSQQAVKSAELLNPRWKERPCFSIGSATTRQIETLGGKVAYQPASFYGKVLSEEIAMKFHDKKIVYLRPKEVSFDSKTFLENAGISIDEKIIYETHCCQYDNVKKPLKNAIIIFTSPSTIKCFFKNFSWDVSYTAVVIGKATKAHLPKDVSHVVANEATIDACIDKANDILLSSNSK